MISPLAYVDSAAKIGKNVTIQPFAFIEGNVEIGDDCIIMSGAKILHGTRMGKGNKVHHNAVLGAEPQDFHYTGENSMLIIGDNNDIRENVVVSRATHAGSATRIGNENYLMDGVHLCHDVQIGNHCVLGIKTTVAGECQIDDCTILSSNVILHQYCHIGSWVLIQAGCRISKDVPPYIIMNGNPAEYHGINAAVLQHKHQVLSLIHIYEDTGTIMGAVTLPPGTSQERAQEILNRVDSLVAADPAVQSRTVISGYSFLGGQGPSYGSLIIKLKNWEERSTMQNSTIVYATLYMRAQKIIKEAQVLFFAPPMIPGYSASSDIELNMQDKTGGDLNHFFDVVNNYNAALEARPEINSAKTSFNPHFPQYQLDIDAAACKKAGISPNDILTTLQGYYGGLYASNFNSFGKMYRVMVQAEPDATKNMETLQSIKVRNGNEMAPITQFISIKKVYGPDVISRFNLYTSMKVMVAPASGYTSGQALQAIAEVAQENLPAGFGYELGGMAREEAETSGSTTGLIFILCFVFVYLLLSAQYESYILPLSVLLSVPFGLLGSFLFVGGIGALGSIPALKMILGTMSNDIYMQIALIMLMGLLAKNAILIVEFALERRRMGMSITWAAVLGAAARLRPILMTSLAMIVGLLPLMFASGAGANGNRTLGTSAIGGMLIGMILQIFIVPALFVAFQYLQEKFKPMEWEDVDNSDAEPEIEQYTK